MVSQFERRKDVVLAVALFARLRIMEKNRFHAAVNGGSVGRVPDLSRRADHAAPRNSLPPAGGIGAPSAAYSLSLLRKVRIEMPRILAAWVRLPRQCLSVSRIRSRSTSATVRPTRLRVTCSAASAACAAVPVAFT